MVPVRAPPAHATRMVSFRVNIGSSPVFLVVLSVFYRWIEVRQLVDLSENRDGIGAAGCKLLSECRSWACRAGKSAVMVVMGTTVHLWLRPEKLSVDVESVVEAVDVYPQSVAWL